ncbi:MAG: cytidylate kinase-like family protein [Planctomycetes bacterium]|nr:cytidylate kinase-like family protein [Planctomycetota bacterium]
MAIITISRGSHSRGKEIAERVARELGYECFSREILLEASQEFNVPELRLERALHDAPSFLDRLTHRRERYVAFIRQSFLERVRRDNVVYHGLAGHFFVQHVSHVLKVRIVADLKDRIRLVMARDNLGEAAAAEFLAKIDRERRRWGQALYGIDTDDPRLYDLVVHVHRISTDDAVRMIRDTAALPHFRATPESRQALDDLLLSARVKAAVVEKWPVAEVEAKEGGVVVTVEAALAQEVRANDEIRRLVGGVEGLKDLRVRVLPYNMGGPPRATGGS